jgi:O-antigen/teichoic acid export membrane protein
MQKLLARFRTDQFLKHNAVFGLGSISVSLINYSYYVVMGRLMSVEEFGEVQTLFSFITQTNLLLGVFGLLAVHITANHEDPGEKHRKLSQLYLCAFYLMLALAAVLLLTAPLLTTALRLASPRPLVLLALLLLGVVPLTFRRAFLQALYDFHALSLAGLIVAVGRLAFGALLVLAGLSTGGALAGLLMAHLVSLWFVWQKTHRTLRLPLTNRLVMDSELGGELGYGCLIVCAIGLVTFLSTADMVVMKYFFPPDVAGFYAGVSTISNIIYFATGSMTGVLMASVKMKSLPQENWGLLTKAVLLISAIGGTVLVIFSPCAPVGSQPSHGPALLCLCQPPAPHEPGHVCLCPDQHSGRLLPGAKKKIPAVHFPLRHRLHRAAHSPLASHPVGNRERFSCRKSDNIGHP